MSESVDLKTLDRVELECLAAEMREPPYRGRQIFEWIYGKGVRTFDEMTNLPLRFRERLGHSHCIGEAVAETVETSSDGTAKALLRLESGRHVEAVLIPDVDGDHIRRLTACVSSQVGCAMACAFCATGTMGFQQNLTSGEIFDQAHLMNTLATERYGRGLTNIVFMGMGEPMLNYANVVKSIRIITDAAGIGLAPRRITVSTVGISRRIRQLADDDPGVRLAVSLHAPSDAQRSSIMPVNRAAQTDLKALREALEYYWSRTTREVTYEYCLFDRFNDSVKDADALAEISRWVPSKVNLLMYNAVPGLPFRRTPDDTVNQFARVLVQRGVTVTIRKSRGQDIDAACGQLAVRESSQT
jgi:23S rRNA (adenine2503-C2)-methyltransferase